MGKSVRKTPICGITTAKSEKEDKRLANRPERRCVKNLLKTDAEVEIFPHKREISSVWDMAKDGRQYTQTNTKKS